MVPEFRRRDRQIGLTPLADISTRKAAAERALFRHRFQLIVSNSWLAARGRAPNYELALPQLPAGSAAIKQRMHSSMKRGRVGPSVERGIVRPFKWVEAKFFQSPAARKEDPC